MPRDDNYPADIRQYDNDPRSPFFDDHSAEIEAAETDLSTEITQALVKNQSVNDIDREEIMARLSTESDRWSETLNDLAWGLYDKKTSFVTIQKFANMIRVQIDMQIDKCSAEIIQKRIDGDIHGS